MSGARRRANGKPEKRSTESTRQGDTFVAFKLYGSRGLVLGKGPTKSQAFTAALVHGVAPEMWARFPAGADVPLSGAYFDPPTKQGRYESEGKL
jgi:hypothetical protein